jgi:hypothetical protein
VQYNASTGEAGVYYQNASHAIAWNQWIPGKGWSGEMVLGGSAEPNTSPSVTAKPGNGQTTVYYQTASDALAYWQYNASSGWANGFP